MADSRLLLNGLIDYRATLERHVRQVRDEFAELEIRWRAFSAVYEGDAAEQFKEGWARTTARFGEYVERTAAIARVLDDRIDDLRAANRQESGLIG